MYFGFLVLSAQILSAVTGECKYTFNTGDAENHDVQRILWCDWGNWFLLASDDGRVKLYEITNKMPIIAWHFPDDMICRVGFDGVHLIFCGFTNTYIIDFLQLKAHQGQPKFLQGQCHCHCHCNH